MNTIGKMFLLVLLLVPLWGTAKEIGPNVAVYRGEELKWEEGAYSYWVMFKSLLANKDTSNDYSGGLYNPQADDCLDSSAYALDMTKVPLDAQIERAFIVWSGAQPIAKLNDFTDNVIRLDFEHNSEPAMNKGLDVVGRQSRLSDAQDFEFGAEIKSDTNGDRGYFTYRVDITNFFKQLQETGRSLGLSDGTVDGMSLYGAYTVSGLDCTKDDIYVSSSTMVSSWAIILVYVSAEVTPKKLYIYDGFKGYFHETSMIQITGFEFPDKPAIRLTLMVNEGDPGLVNTTTSTIPESLQIKGDGVNFEQLFNSCNYLAEYNNMGQPFYYTEIFNSISSEYGFDALAGETCLGGTPPNIDTNTMEYAIDVDTFYIDQAVDTKWANQFFKGGQQITLMLGANQDWVLTNFLILSHDTRAGNYDIPPHQGHPEDVAEKGFCSCVPANEKNAVCFTQEYIYYMKIQNWGDDIVTNVKVRDTLSQFVKYVPGTTQIATKIHEDENGNWIGEDWQTVPDGPGDEFPFAQWYQVAEQMNYCENTAAMCAGDHDRRMVRWKVKPIDDLPKNAVIENLALIGDAATSSKPYKTNNSVPLKLHSGTCQSLATCEQMDLSPCGGPWDADTPVTDVDSVTDADAPADCSTSGAQVEFALGKNSPIEYIVIPNPRNSLILGQFSLIGKTGGDKTNCTFTLNRVKVKFQKEQTVTLANLKLVHDQNGNGIAEGSETVVSEAATLDAGYAMFDLLSTRRKFRENTTHYFLIVADASVSAASVAPNTSFQGRLEGAAAFEVNASEGTVVSTTPVSFAEFIFEPDAKSFVVTRGEKDPAVPATLQEINADIPVLHLRTKAKGEANKLKSLSLSVPSGAVLFGEGLQSVSLWLDANGNGLVDPGEQKLAEGSGAKGDANLTLTLTQPLSYAADEEKFLIVKADFDLSGSEKGRIQVKQVGLDSNATVFKLPVTSKEFQACTDPNDPNCAVVGDEDEGGCGCSVIGRGNAGAAASALFTVLLSLLLFIFARRFGSDR